MFTRELSPRVFAIPLIVLGHAAALYALTLAGPQMRSTPVSTPVELHFIAEPRAHAHWEPRRVSVERPPLTLMPEMPSVEIPAQRAASSHAIRVQVQSLPARVSLNRDGPRLVSSVEYVREPAPRYPAQSRRLREQGLVILRVLIDEQGIACRIEVESSSGHARLDAAARDAVARAVFRPYIEEGEPRRALVLIPIEFALNRGAV